MPKSLPAEVSELAVMGSPTPPSALLNKDGSVSKMRAHRGNIPTLPQTKACPHCSARFTRSTHLTRHIKNHTDERDYRCTTCPAQFTRSDLLARHRKNCEDPNRPNRLRSCIQCTESKVKCDRNDPCSRCKAKGRECSFANSTRKKSPPGAGIGPYSSSIPSESSPSSIASTSPSPTDNPSTKDASLSPRNSLSDELGDLTTMGPAPVRSHLSPVYENDVFQPLFSDVFSSSGGSSSLDEFPLSFSSMEEIPLRTGPWFQELSIFPGNSLLQGEGERRAVLSDFFRRESKAADPTHYLHLFFNAFLGQMPIAHGPTFKLEDKPPYLLQSIKACGALFVRTPTASTYITESLAAAREGLAQAFAETLTEPTEQVHLVIAVVLLQTIGLFHQKADERATSSIYHAMLVMMIRRAGLISKNYSWTPPNNVSKEDMWREWAFREMTKRALLLSYLHDCAQRIFFGLPQSYIPGEVTLQLPCEDSLWTAASADEWLSVLQTPSRYQSSRDRLIGPDLGTNLAAMLDPQFIPAPNLSLFAHFILVHAILCDLFAACSESVNPTLDTSLRGDAAPTQAILASQYALHNFLHSWTSNRAGYPSTGELSFFHNALPFYWLGQVAILAHQEGLPPFNSSNNETGEIRFKMVKRWLRRIKEFLTEGDGESTLFWDELMKIRLQAWQLEYDTDGGADDQEGLLGFFP
ncbi:hypothetical protein C8F04DRAFT_1087327 [Mycena alexandri]|uniref:Uncharacterized protein n=1 Tax=Mycena alexandri TaxID=1745969 RepID=A0AAD6XBG4_9AGAR|nr:hypothetical protein C8F04DRAFT_1087327 [Mycena alexandri]